MATFEFKIGDNEFRVEAADEKSALEKAMLAQGKAQEPSFREQFAGVMERGIGQPVAKGIEKLTEMGMPSSREPAVPGGPSTARMTGEAVSQTMIPRTPEGVVLSALPFTRPGAAMMATGPRALATLPAVGAGVAALSGGTGEDITMGGVQGAVGGATVAGTRIAQKVLRRITGKEPSVRNVEAAAAENILDTDAIVAGLEADRGIKLSGRTSAEKIIKGPEHVQGIISTDYGAMQNAVEKGLKGQTLSLPFLGQIRGRTITVPGTPAAPVLGPNGKPVAGQGTPTRTVVDTEFTPKEALDALKDFGAYVRKQSYTAAGEPKGGEPMTGRQLREYNRAVRAELQSALSARGRQDLADQFGESSAFYAKGLELKNLLEGIKPTIKGGGTQTGGFDTQSLRDLLNSGKLAEPQDFPATFEAAHRGQSLGAREVQRPGVIAGGQRVYGGSMGFSPSLPATRIPIGTQMQISGMPGRLTGAGTMLGVEDLLKERQKPPKLKDIVPMLSPSVGIE